MCSVDVIVTVDSSIISIVIFFNPLILNMLMIESCCTTMCCVLTFKSSPRNRRRCYSNHHSRRLFLLFIKFYILWKKHTLPVSFIQTFKLAARMYDAFVREIPAPPPLQFSVASVTVIPQCTTTLSLSFFETSRTIHTHPAAIY